MQIPVTKWVNLLHIYQPPWQEPSIVLELYQKSYLNIVETLEANPQIQLTLNVAGSLTEQLLMQKKHKFFDRIRSLVNKRQVELVGSAMYHPILPLIPNAEVKRQIGLNEELNKSAFKDEWLAAETNFGGRGFFLPEVAYSPAVAKIIKEMGFDWLVVDSMGFGEKAKIDWSKNYIDQESGIRLLIRDHSLWPITTELIRNVNSPRIVTVSDGEIYQKTSAANKHIIDLARVVENRSLDFQTVGTYFKEIANNEKVLVNPVESNWEMNSTEFKLKSPFHVWSDKNNQIHQKLWNLIYSILDLYEEYKQDENISEVRTALDKAISSCTWWWVDGRYHGYNPDEVTKGLNHMIRVVRNFENLPLEIRLKFEKIFSEMIYLVWEKHWTNRETKKF